MESGSRVWAARRTKKHPPGRNPAKVRCCALPAISESLPYDSQFARWFRVTRLMTASDFAEAPVLAPTQAAQRIQSMDVVRGVAVLGILLMNIAGMGLPDPAYWDPSGWGGESGWNFGVWWVNSVLFEGTMRALFSMLFGAGVLLFTGKGDAKDVGLSVADAWYRRTIWLFLFGLAHSYLLLWPGEILYAYGLMGLFLFPFRNTAPRRLFQLGLALLLIGAGLYLADNLNAVRSHQQALRADELQQQGETVPEDLAAGRDAWNEKVAMMQPDQASKEAIIAKNQSGYLSALQVRAESTYWIQSEYHYRYSYFDILSMMLIGMALFKWRVFQAELPARTYFVMILFGYGFGIPLSCYETSTYAAENFALDAYYRLSVTYDLGRVLMVTGHLGVIALFCQSGRLGWLRSTLAAVGRMALTNYILQTVITTTVFVGLAQFGKWERHQLYYLVLGIWVFQLLASPWWLRRFHFGPMEWLWRSLTYLRRQPFARASAVASKSV